MEEDIKATTLHCQSSIIDVLIVCTTNLNRYHGPSSIASYVHLLKGHWIDSMEDIYHVHSSGDWASITLPARLKAEIYREMNRLHWIAPPSDTPLWTEMVDEEGRSYYLNSVTGESRWEDPSEHHDHTAASSSDSAAHPITTTTGLSLSGLHIDIDECPSAPEVTRLEQISPRIPAETLLHLSMGGPVPSSPKSSGSLLEAIKPTKLATSPLPQSPTDAVAVGSPDSGTSPSPLLPGMWECKVCTLHNKSHIPVCAACNAERDSA